MIAWLYCLNVYGYNSVHVQAIIQKAQQAKFINASGCDLRSCAALLQQVNFSGAQLSGALFDGNDSSNTPTIGTVKIDQPTILAGVNFSGAVCVSTSFRKANLQNADFSKANILYADFSGADLRGAKLSKAQNITLARFDGAIMPDGSKCTGQTWKNADGKVFYCHASKK